MDRICIICGKPVPDGSDLMDRFGVHHDIHASCWPEVARLAAELTEGKREAEYLANLLWERHYKNESPNFEKLNTIAGVVSQIDNMIAGLIEERDQALAKCDRALAKCDSLNEKLGTWMGRAGNAEARWYEALSLVEAVTERADSAEKSLHEALARAAAAAMEMREQAAVRCYEDQGRFDTPDRIRALTIDPDAKKALDQMLAKAREDGIREAADVLAREYNICDIPINGVVINGSELTSPASCRDAILALLNDGGRDG